MEPAREAAKLMFVPELSVSFVSSRLGDMRSSLVQEVSRSSVISASGKRLHRATRLDESSDSVGNGCPRPWTAAVAKASGSDRTMKSSISSVLEHSLPSSSFSSNHSCIAARRLTSWSSMEQHTNASRVPSTGVPFCSNLKAKLPSNDELCSHWSAPRMPSAPSPKSTFSSMSESPSDSDSSSDSRPWSGSLVSKLAKERVTLPSDCLPSDCFPCLIALGLDRVFPGLPSGGRGTGPGTSSIPEGKRELCPNYKRGVQGAC
mmetsp:Transcript_34385/g.93124  ORF Transcript_34385/g.93124 Transcript_34385/m.93124 type:complete len:261 (+) Transcript_34385:381-1163(+)